MVPSYLTYQELCFMETINLALLNNNSLSLGVVLLQGLVGCGDHAEALLRVSLVFLRFKSCK